MKLTAYRLILSGTSLVIATIVLVGGISLAFGQDRLTANVPFSFRAGGSTLAAGNYDLAPASVTSDRVIRLYNSDTHNGIVVSIQNPIYGYGRSADPRPRMVFRRSSGGCVMSEVWTGLDGWQFALPKLSPAEKERVAVVYFTRNTSGD